VLKLKRVPPITYPEDINCGQWQNCNMKRSFIS